MNAIVGFGVNKVMAPRIAASIMFVVGPAMAVLPMIFLSIKLPDIITAPGLMSLKGDKMLMSVISAPHSVRRNSAHRP